MDDRDETVLPGALGGWVVNKNHSDRMGAEFGNAIGGGNMDKPTPNDPVNQPSHYAQGDIECIDAMVSAFGAANVKMWAQLNAFKYIWRHERKGESEDIRKAIWYLEYSIGNDPRR